MAAVAVRLPAPVATKTVYPTIRFTKGLSCLSGKARFFASKAEEKFPPSIFPTSTLGLGLDTSLALPCLDSIRQLPEVADSLDSILTNSMGGVGSLKRSVDVFESIQPGGDEHKAVLALLADCQIRSGLIEDALITLDKIAPLVQGDKRHSLDVMLARSKVFWLGGFFDKSQAICEELLEDARLEDMPLHMASARSGQALNRLVSAETLDDAFTLRDPARMAVRAIEPYRNVPLPLAFAELNYGAAEAIYAEIVGRENEVEVPLDNAMRAWKRGLTSVKRYPQGGTLSSHIAARLQASMAWGLLKMTKHPNNTEQASDYAGKALKIYDHRLTEDSEKEGLTRVLSLVATCYHQTSQAVTAEGLFQSALDRKAVGPQQKIDRYHTQIAYSKLCRDWEKREPDVNRLNIDAATTIASVPDAWKDKPEICSSLWFWTPNLFS